MKLPFRKQKNVKLEEAKEHLLNQLLTTPPDSPLYPKLVVMLERLNDLDAKSRRKSVTPDTLAICLTNVLIPLVIVAYEQKHILATQAKTFITKLK